MSQYLFIGGPADAEVREVDDLVTQWAVANPVKHSLEKLNAPKENYTTSTIYTKREVKKGSWRVALFFADHTLSDKDALARYIECVR